MDCERMKFRILFNILILFGILFVPGCGYYSLKGSLPPHLKTVAIPLMENKTAEFGITETLTDAVTDEFVRDGSLKITDRSSADVLLIGSITFRISWTQSKSLSVPVTRYGTNCLPIWMISKKRVKISPVCITFTKRYIKRHSITPLGCFTVTIYPLYHAQTMTARANFVT